MIESRGVQFVATANWITLYEVSLEKEFHKAIFQKEFQRER